VKGDGGARNKNEESCQKDEQQINEPIILVFQIFNSIIPHAFESELLVHYLIPFLFPFFAAVKRGRTAKRLKKERGEFVS
jgi:hypothetical protein